MDNYNSLNKQVPVLYPTYEEFKNLSAYIISQEQRIIQSQFGAFKIVPPFRWVPVTNCFSSIRIKSYLTQRITPSSKVNHVYQIKNIITTKRRAMFYEEFKRLAESEHHHLSDSIDDVEEYFWKSIHEQTSTMHPPIYAADINSSLFSKKETICSFSNLKSLLNYYPLDIKGVTTPYLYIGMWGSVFGMHTEDCDLYSLNYLHYGAAKIWYVIPPAYADRLENFVNDNNLIELSGDEKLCTAPIQHKTLLIHPNLLIQNNIDCHQIIQKQNEIVCILPRSYHFGFNCGLNIAEAINYALPSWINYGMKTKICSCVQPVVKLDMQHFTTDIVDKFEQDIGKTKLPLTNFSFSQQPTDPITHVSDLFVDTNCHLPESTHNHILSDDMQCVDFEEVQLLNDLAKVYTLTTEISQQQQQKQEEEKWKQFEEKLMHQIRLNMLQFSAPSTTTTAPTLLHTVSKRMKKRKCYFCQQYGHYRDNCPKYLARRNK